MKTTKVKIKGRDYCVGGRGMVEGVGLLGGRGGGRGGATRG